MKTTTNTATHTPGPWSADKWAPGYTVSAPESHYSICHLEGCNNEEANARLIAAAPELLALAVALRNAAVNTPTLDSSEEWTELINEADKVIAKAEGRT